MKVLGKLGLAVFMVVGFFANRSAIADAGMTDSEPKIEIGCVASTRVVALNLVLGIDPLQGSVTYRLMKYHALDAAQNYTQEGSNLSAYNQTVTIGRSFGVLKIHAKGAGVPTRLTRKEGLHDFELTARLVKRADSYVLQGLIINSFDHLAGNLGAIAHCSVSQ